MIEKSLVLLKPDAVKRGIVGEILHRFERTGLKFIAVKFMEVDRALAAAHYNKDDAWKIKIGHIRLDDAKTYGLDVVALLGSSDPLEIGEKVNQANFDYLTQGPVLALVFEGPNAVVKIKTLVGPTFSHTAPPGTIRGDFGIEAPLTSFVRKRTIFNMIHCSDTSEEATREIALWFKPEEILSYKSVQDDLYSY